MKFYHILLAGLLSCSAPVIAMDNGNAAAVKTEMSYKEKIAQVIAQLPVEKAAALVKAAALIGACDAVSTVAQTYVQDYVPAPIKGIVVNSILFGAIKLYNTFHKGMSYADMLKSLVPTELVTESTFGKKPLLASLLTISSLINSYAAELGISPTAAYSLFFTFKIANFEKPAQDAALYNLSSSLYNLIPLPNVKEYL